MPAARTRGVNTAVASVFGAVYLLIGVFGFLLTGLDGFADPASGRLLVAFAVNPLHNVVHLAIGLALLAASRSVLASRLVSGAIGAVYLLVGLLGLFIASPSNGLNVLALNGADNVLHLFSAMVLLGVAGTFDRGRRPATA